MCFRNGACESKLGGFKNPSWTRGSFFSMVKAVAFGESVARAVFLDSGTPHLKADPRVVMYLMEHNIMIVGLIKCLQDERIALDVCCRYAACIWKDLFPTPAFILSELEHRMNQGDESRTWTSDTSFREEVMASRARRGPDLLPQRQWK